MQFVDLWSRNDSINFDTLFDDLKIPHDIREDAVKKGYFWLVEQGSFYRMYFDVTDVFPFIIDHNKFLEFRYFGKHHEFVVTTLNFYDYTLDIPEHLHPLFSK